MCVFSVDLDILLLVRGRSGASPNSISSLLSLKDPNLLCCWTASFAPFRSLFDGISFCIPWLDFIFVWSFLGGDEWLLACLSFCFFFFFFFQIFFYHLNGGFFQANLCFFFSSTGVFVWLLVALLVWTFCLCSSSICVCCSWLNCRVDGSYWICLSGSINHRNFFIEDWVMFA